MSTLVVHGDARVCPPDGSCSRGKRLGGVACVRGVNGNGAECTAACTNRAVVVGYHSTLSAPLLES